MISTEQADIASADAIDLHREPLPSWLRHADGRPRVYRLIGFAVGGVLGTIISLMWHGSNMPGQGIGMLLGALGGAWLDGWRGTGAMFCIGAAGVLGVAAMWFAKQLF
jgi:hypothetical protein